MERRAARSVVAGAIIALLTLLLGAAPVLAESAPAYSSVEDLEGATIAYINGSVYGLAVAERIDGTTEVYYPSLPDCVEAVRSGKADAACGITYCCELAVNRSNGEVALLPERVKDVEEGFFFRKGDPLRDSFDQLLDKLRADGTLDALQAKWVAADDSGKILPEQDWDAPNGTLSFATSGVLEPFSYPGPDGRPCGYDVELALLIAKELGYRLEVQMIPMDSIFAAVETGKADFGGTLTVTPERQEMVDFTGSVMDVGIGLIVHAKEGVPTDRIPEYGSIEELNGLRFGIVTGSVGDLLVEQGGVTPGETLSFNSMADMVAALRAGKIDVFGCDEPIAELYIARNEGITMAPGRFVDTEYALFFAEGSPLIEEFNAVIERYWEDGTMEALRQKWVMGPDEDKVLTPLNPDHPNGTVKMATAPFFEPMSYMGPDGQIVGYDIDLATMICNELGYGLEIDSYNMDGVVAAVQSGKSDFGGTGTTVTAERDEVVDFSTPTYHVPFVAIVREQAGGSAAADFLAGLRDSFERTFIVENRWRLVLVGLGVTLLITLLSSVFGTCFGVTLTFLRNRGAIANGLIEGFQTVMGGLPIVVVLMLLYYVVFGSVDIPGVIVAILGFTLSFGATACSNIWNAIRAVDPGQDEAALALGYNEDESFRKVVLPQASSQFLPLLLGQVLSLVKETSIVGYIAVQDLTRAGDLIRTRTMEAFFPLFATAAIYFLICWLMRRIGARLVDKCDPESRPRVIKGVEM